jgi:hypothetical protein
LAKSTKALRNTPCTQPITKRAANGAISTFSRNVDRANPSYATIRVTAASTHITFTNQLTFNLLLPLKRADAKRQINVAAHAHRGMSRAMTLYEMELVQYQKQTHPPHSRSQPNATTKHNNRRSANTSRAFVLKLLDQQLSLLPLLMQPGGIFLFPILAIEHLTKVLFSFEIQTIRLPLSTQGLYLN